MIATGRFTDAERAADQLRSALAAAGIALPVSPDSRVWDCQTRRPVRLVAVEPMLPDIALAMAGALRAGAQAVEEDRAHVAPLSELLARSAQLGRAVEAHLKALGKR
ncbi:hypothetical protein [Streptomyces sp. SM12]|uniref:hypothetical protein n=1 Tax=Streptomyces sp. SM12 TaxID=1071602 RepID=UPI00215622A7|nr:hypothetical protein [Streptomyces sp. SM12]